MTDPLFGALQAVHRAIAKKEYRAARLGWINPDTGAIQFQALGRPDNWVLVRPVAGTDIQPEAVENRGVGWQYDLAVRIKRDPVTGLPFIEGTDPIGSSEFNNGGNTPSSVQRHNHAYGSGNEYYTDPRYILGCLVTPTNPPTLSVQITPGFYFYNGNLTYFPGITYDLTSFIPGSASQHCWVLVGINPATPAPIGVAGTAVDVSIALTPFDLASIAFSGYIPLAGVLLTNGETVIRYESDFIDARAFVSGIGGNSSGVTGTGTDRHIPTWNGTSVPALRDNANASIDSAGNLTANAFVSPASTTLTIASNAVTITQGFHVIESSSGITDNLATINGGVSRQFLMIKADADDTITVKHGTGNIFLAAGADFAMSGHETLLLFFDGTNWTDVGIPSSGGGTVTSVALSMPAIFSVSGSPITTSGTFNVTLANESANQVLAGPASGSAAAPTFRALTNIDVPGVEGILVVAANNSGSINIAAPGATMDGVTLNANDRVLLLSQSTLSQNGPWVWNGAAVPMTRPPDFPSGGTTQAYYGVTFKVRGSGATWGGSVWFIVTTGAITIDTTSFQLAQWFMYIGVPGNLSGTLNTSHGGTGVTGASANTVFAGPTSVGVTAPAFRGLVAADIPALSYVTSVALTMPAIFSVSGSPITASGTFAVTLANENANLGFFGPASGAAAAPTFRNMDARDITDFPREPEGRLTLTSGTPATTADVTAATTIYYSYTSFGSDLFPYYDGTRWNYIHASDNTSVAVPSTVFRLFDIFATVSAGTLSLATVSWNQTTGSITAATNATPVAITSTAHGRSTGDVLAFTGLVGNTALNGFVFSITVTGANTFTVDGSKGNGTYSSGGTWYLMSGATRATALTTQNGVPVKNGDTTSLYLGTGCTGATSGQMDDSAAHRLLWNQYNRVRKPMRIVETAASWSSSSTTITSPLLTNHNGANVFWCVIGQVVSELSIRSAEVYTSAGQVANRSAIGENSCNTTATNIIGGRMFTNSAGSFGETTGYLDTMPALGFDIYAWIEGAGGSANTIQNQNQDISGMQGSIDV